MIDAILASAHSQRQLATRGLVQAASIPDIDWVDVSGTEPGAPIKLEDDAGDWPVSPFRISRYPITNAQFAAFTQAGGYDTEDWWGGMPPREKQARQPTWTEWNCPRETVSWYEAVASVALAIQCARGRGSMWEALTTRLQVLSLRLCGWLLLR